MTPPPPAPNTGDVAPDVATTFLLAEHTRLCGLYVSTRETAERRVTLFLTLTTTIVGVSVAFYQLNVPIPQLLETALLSAIGISLLGLTTYHRLLERSVQSTEYLRAINRIHHYFIERAPDTEPYLFWAPYDNIPPYNSHGIGGIETREVILYIDCVAVGIAVALLLVVSNNALVLPAIIAAPIAFAIALLAHQQYERFLLVHQEKTKSTLVRFPLPRDRHPSTGQQINSGD